MECNKCKMKFNELYSKTKYNGNEDDNDYCGDCYFFQHGEYFTDTEFEVIDEKIVATRVKSELQ